MDYHKSPSFSSFDVKETEYSSSEGVGENAFGVKRAIQVIKKTTYAVYFPQSDLRKLGHTKTDQHVLEGLEVSLPLGPDDAAKVKEQLRALIICKLASPYAGTHNISGEATVDEPLQEDYTNLLLHVSVLGVWFFDSTSGKILMKLPAVAKASFKN